MMRLTLVAALVALLVTPATATVYWDSYQGDNRNSGTGQYDAMQTTGAENIFNFVWQKKAAGAVGATMLAVDDLNVYGCYGWPSGIQALDRFNGGQVFSRGDMGNDLGTHCVALTSTTLYHAIGGNMYGTPVSGVASYSTADPGDLPSGRLMNITPGGDVLGFRWDNTAYAAQDTGGAFVNSFTAATLTFTCFSLPAILEHSTEGTLVVNSGRGDTVKAWYLSTGAEVWSYTGPGGSDGSPSVDSSGNTYVGLGWGHGNQWAVGLDEDGVELFRTNLPSVDGFQARFQSAGCLSYDEGTYYVQTVAFYQENEQGEQDIADHGQLYAIDTATGALKWTYDTGSVGWEMGASSPMATKDGLIFVGNNNGNTIYALRDAGVNAQLVATHPTAASANMNFSQGPDGTIYFPGNLAWNVGAGPSGDEDGEPDGSYQWLWNAIQPVGASMAGDVDGNGVVDGLDLTAVLTAWETVPGDPLWNEAADLDDNDVVNGLDLTEVISNWTIASAAAPEAAASASDAKPGRGNAGRATGNVKAKKK